MKKYRVLHWSVVAEKIQNRNCRKYPKIGTMWFYYRQMHPYYADGMANSVDPDNTAPE